MLPTQSPWSRAAAPVLATVPDTLVVEVVAAVPLVPGLMVPPSVLPDPFEPEADVLVEPDGVDEGVPITAVMAPGANTAPVGDTENAMVVRQVGLPCGDERSIKDTGSEVRMGVVWRSTWCLMTPPP